MSKPTNQPESQFSDWIATYGGGVLNDRLTAALREVAEQVVLLDKAGAISIKLTIAAKAGGVIVSPKVTTTAPEGKESGQFFFVTADGSLSRRDPNQPQLPSMEDQK